MDRIHRHLFEEWCTQIIRCALMENDDKMNFYERKYIGYKKMIALL